MKLLLHTITASDVPMGAPPGVRDQCLTRTVYGELVAWTTVWTMPHEDLGRADLLAHHEIISRLLEQTDACLPARFPTWLLNADALRAHVNQKSSQLYEALERVRGRCELAVTGVWTAPADDPLLPEATTPGTRYLLGRQQAQAGSTRRRERARELAQEIERAATPDLVDIRHQLCPSQTIGLSSALLVPRPSATALKSRMGQVHEDVRILVNGPWPAYTFAGVGVTE